MNELAIRTKHRCPECDVQVHMVLTSTLKVVYHPEHGSVHVAEGVELDDEDALWQFSNEKERAPEHVCFVCGWSA